MGAIAVQGPAVYLDDAEDVAAAKAEFEKLFKAAEAGTPIVPALPALPVAPVAPVAPAVLPYGGYYGNYLGGYHGLGYNGYAGYPYGTYGAYAGLCWLSIRSPSLPTRSPSRQDRIIFQPPLQYTRTQKPPKCHITLECKTLVLISCSIGKFSSSLQVNVRARLRNLSTQESPIKKFQSFKTSAFN